MPFPTQAELTSAFSNIRAAAAHNPANRTNLKEAVELGLDEMANKLRDCYRDMADNAIDMTVTDTYSVTASLLANSGLAAKTAKIAASQGKESGDVITTTPAQVGLDTFVGTTLAASKSAATAAGDVFVMTTATDLAGAPLVEIKGAALALGDMYAVKSIAAPAIVYLGNRVVAAGDLFQAADDGDTSEDSLETLKGAAVAAGDVFQATSASALEYVGPSGLTLS
jgi:hypothetical protein